MKKSIKLFMVVFLFVTTNWAKETTTSSIVEFIKGFKMIKLPFTTTSLTSAKNVSNEFFYYEKGNDYYELQDLRCYGYFKKESIIYLLYNFNLIGEGEGFADNMIILSSFYTTGEHIEDVELQGAYGGEGGAYIYEKAVVSEKDIIIDLRDEHYGVDTGLGYTITEHKRYIYSFNKKYSLIEEEFRCNMLKSLEGYCLQLQKGDESKDDSIYGLSYLLNNYKYCYPVTKSNINTYKRIWNYIRKHINNKSVELLSKELKKFEVASNLLMVSVNNLRLRDTAGLKGNKIGSLPMHSEVFYLQEKSKYMQEVIINNRKIVDYWYKVKTKKGEVGWLHGCCVNSL